jgi:hypothetical protein
MYRHPKKDEIYMIKQYTNKKHYDEFITEKAVLKIANKHIENLFPKILGYDDLTLHENQILLCEGIRASTLEQFIENNYTKLEFSQIANAIKPITTLHTQLNQYSHEIEDEMRSLSNGRVKHITDLNKHKCVLNIVSQFRKPNKESYKLVKGLLIDYIFRNEYKVLAPHDGFPRQNLVTRLVDAGNIYKLPCIIHLGCTVGLPVIYDKFGDGLKEMKSCVNFYLQNTQIKADTDEFLAGLYLASVYANLRMINFNRIFKEDTSKFKATAIEQARVFSELDKTRGKEFYELMLKEL